MTHTPLHSAMGKRRFSRRVDPALLRRREDMDRGIANPHLGFPRRGLRTRSDPRINNTAGRIMQYSPNPHLERGAIKFAGRPTWQSAARFYKPTYDDTVTEIPIDTPYGRKSRGVLNDLKAMGKDLIPDYDDLTKSQRGESLLDYYFNQPPGGAVDVTGEETPGVSLGHLQKYHTPEENEGYDPILGNWMEDEMMRQAQPPGGAVDMTGQYRPQPERPPWDNWFGNLIRNLRGQNRGGLASLKYAR